MRWLLLVLLTLYSELAWPCSSCGSGGADPLILFPYETLKVYAGPTIQSGFRDIQSDGSQATHYGPTRKRHLTTAVAWRYHSHGFVSLTGGVQENLRGDQQKQAITDPLLTVRHTLLRQNMLQPWQPQVQAIAAHKKSVARSIQHTRAPYALDVFGNGYDETKVGIDLWLGHTDWVGGGSLFWLPPTSQTTAQGKLEKRAEQQRIITFGRQIPGLLKMIGGLRQRVHPGLRLNGETISDSEVRANSWFVTLESIRKQTWEARVSYAVSGSWGDNRNSFRSSSLTLALIGRIL
jgi:hypothetical protein